METYLKQNSWLLCKLDLKNYLSVIIIKTKNYSISGFINSGHMEQSKILMLKVSRDTEVPLLGQLRSSRIPDDVIAVRNSDVHSPSLDKELGIHCVSAWRILVKELQLYTHRTQIKHNFPSQADSKNRGIMCVAQRQAPGCGPASKECIPYGD